MTKDTTRTRYQPQRLRHLPTVVESVLYDGTAECAEAIMDWSKGRFMYDDFGRLCALTPDGLRYLQEGGTAVLGTQGEPYMLQPAVRAACYVEVAVPDYRAPLTPDRVTELAAEAQGSSNVDRLRDIVAQLAAHSEALTA